VETIGLPSSTVT